MDSHAHLVQYNVLIDAHGNACLVDFGISHAYDSRQILDSTKVGRQESLNWVAPEILRDPENFRMTPQTDMYGFACVLYEASGYVAYHYFLLYLSPRFTRETSLFTIRTYCNACSNEGDRRSMRWMSLSEG